MAINHKRLLKVVALSSIFLLSACAQVIGSFSLKSRPPVVDTNQALFKKPRRADNAGKLLVSFLTFDYQRFSEGKSNYVDWTKYKSELDELYLGSIKGFSEGKVAECFSYGCGDNGIISSIRLYILYYIIKNSSLNSFSQYNINAHNDNDRLSNAEKTFFSQVTLSLLQDKDKFLSSYQSDYEIYILPSYKNNDLEKELLSAYEFVKPRAFKLAEIQKKEQQALIERIEARSQAIANMPSRAKGKLINERNDPTVQKVIDIINRQDIVFSDLNQDVGVYETTYINNRRLPKQIDIQSFYPIILNEVILCQQMSRYAKTQQTELNYCVLSYIKGIELLVAAINDKSITDGDFHRAFYESGFDLPMWAYLAYSKKRLN